MVYAEFPKVSASSTKVPFGVTRVLLGGRLCEDTLTSTRRRLGFGVCVLFTSVDGGNDSEKDDAAILG